MNVSTTISALGDWDVFNLKGDKIGENKIMIEEYGCLLVEQWTDVNGITGQRYNYVDLSDRRWRQVRVARRQRARSHLTAACGRRMKTAL